MENRVVDSETKVLELETRVSQLERTLEEVQGCVSIMLRDHKRFDPEILSYRIEHLSSGVRRLGAHIGVSTES
ncbi:hypothetical protein CEB3_c17920 [Peptococcaceae bacterium CEB3]|nr:hypothetical protein CEB3_c17920 [Peptococcaceae bacterium CEB3]